MPIAKGSIKYKVNSIVQLEKLRPGGLSSLLAFFILQYDKDKYGELL